MKVIFFILELSFVISNDFFPKEVKNEDSRYFESLENTDYEFDAILKKDDRLNIFIYLDSKQYNQLNESITFYKLNCFFFCQKEYVPLTIIKEANITTLVGVYIASEFSYIHFGITPEKEIQNVTILFKINEYNDNKKIEKTDLNKEKKIKNFDVFSSETFYEFNLRAGKNSYAKLELIFDEKNSNYKNFSLSHIFEYQNDNSNFKILYYLHATETTQGNKTIITFLHKISDKSTKKVVFQLIPNYVAKNVNILGFKGKNKTEDEENLPLNTSLVLISMYSSINYKLMCPIQANHTNHIQLRISNITSLDDNFSQSVNIFECWSSKFKECAIKKIQNFKMNKTKDSTIFLESDYQNKNDSIDHIIFAFKPSCNFYNVSITGFIRENDPETTPNSDSDSDTSSDSAPDSGSSSFAVSISIIISIIIISVIVFFIYFCIKKRRSKDINFDQRDSLGDDFLLNE